jgi:hypothetical protein
MLIDETHFDAKCAALHRCVREATFGRIRSLAVKRVDGILIVEGAAANFYSKQLAIQAAAAAFDLRTQPIEFAIRVREMQHR